MRTYPLSLLSGFRSNLLPDCTVSLAQIFCTVANLDFFQQEAVKEVVVEFQIRLLVFDPSTETIITWIN
jgi:hypothetical protein